MQHGVHFLTATVLLALALILEQSSRGAASAIAPFSNEDADVGSTPQLACHLEELIVDFDDLNLRFITKPKTVNIGQCIGYCPEIGATNYNVYYQLLSRRLGHKTEQFCCVPIEYSSVQVLLTLFNPKSKRYESRLDLLENAQVTKCGCR